MKSHLLTISLLISAPLLFYIAKPLSVRGQVLGTSAIRAPEQTLLTNETTISAKTAFDQKIITDTEEIPYDTEYKDDPDMEYGEEEVLEPGVNGERRTNYLITYWFDELMDKQLDSVEIDQPKTEIVARGTKVVWRDYQSPDGKIRYWRKLHVWATKYDGNCVGCRGLTYSGTPVRKGVCAVDPKVISLGTNFYVVGYGMCRSEDIGGAIKGKHIDLGYEDVSKGAWRTGFTDVYLMTSAPEN